MTNDQHQPPVFENQAITNDPAALKMLADAWDRSQAMHLEGLRQGALLAAALIAFTHYALGNIGFSGQSLATLLAVVSLACSVLLFVAGSIANAWEQQRRLAVVMGMRMPRIGESTPSTLGEAMRYLVMWRVGAVICFALQALCLAVGLIAFVVSASMKAAATT